MNHWGWQPYVPVAQRRQKAKQLANQLSKQGRQLQPIEVQGRAIARTFWGKAWCENLEQYSDFANRLPRGRTYVRNGSVIDLKIEKGTVTSLVSGSDIYEVKIQLTPLQDRVWKAICGDCSDSIDSLLDLLAGRFDSGVMQRLTRRGDGLFPQPDEIKLGCSCPDWATMCKHVAAVLYGVGARLDDSPELLFLLRNVDHTHLLGQASLEAVDEALSAGSSSELDGEDLSALFGIELESTSENPPKQSRSSAKRTSSDSSNRSSRQGSRKKAKTTAGRTKKSTTSGLAASSSARTKSRGTTKKKVTKKKGAASQTKARKTDTATQKAKATKKSQPGERRKEATSSGDSAQVAPRKRKSAKAKKTAVRRLPDTQETARATKTKKAKGGSRKSKSSPKKGARSRAAKR